jgi:shikimate kinase
MTTPPRNSVILVGMPGAGKSTVGVLLAKTLGLGFVDTDLEIQRRANATLQEIVDAEGYLSLRAREESVLLDADLDNRVVATGGSVVYSGPGMARLRAAGPVVYLDAGIDTLAARIAANPLRGIASDPGDSFEAIFAERTPLYRDVADIVVDVSREPPEAIALEIARLLRA